MREILFKAKSENTGEWVEGDLLHNGVDYNVAIRYREKDSSHGFVVGVDEYTICQYTGLTDKNGNKIWENDVVVRVDRRNGIYIFREQPKMNCKVIWSDRHGFDTVPSCGYFDKNNALECEVIGNIFDNPELLKGGE